MEIKFKLKLRFQNRINGELYCGACWARGSGWHVDCRDNKKTQCKWHLLLNYNKKTKPPDVETIIEELMSYGSDLLEDVFKVKLNEEVGRCQGGQKAMKIYQ